MCATDSLCTKLWWNIMEQKERAVYTEFIHCPTWDSRTIGDGSVEVCLSNDCCRDGGLQRYRIPALRMPTQWVICHPLGQNDPIPHFFPVDLSPYWYPVHLKLYQFIVKKEHPQTVPPSISQAIISIFQDTQMSREANVTGAELKGSVVENCASVSIYHQQQPTHQH